MSINLQNKIKVVSEKNSRILLPNLITIIGVCIGLSSIKFALDNRFELSIIAILFAAIMDSLDGRVARLIKGTSKQVDSTLIDMNAFTPENFPFEIKQNPSNLNALGLVKFMFPNRFSIYMHDTPS